jgi:hypothetical protein
MTDEKLNELWVLPTNAKVLLRIDGKTPVYTSKSLRESFIKALAKHPVLKQHIGLMAKLVNKKILNPAWQNKGFLSVLKRSIRTPKRDKITVAFYVPRTGKIFIIIDNNTNWFLHYPNKLLTNTTIHEFCHKFSHEKAVSFWSMYKEELTKFYVGFFRSLFSIPIEKDITKLCEKYARLLLVMFEQKTTRVKTLGLAFGRMKRFIKAIGKHSPLANIDDLIDKHFQLIFEIFKATNTERLLNAIKSNLGIVVHLYKSYSKMGLPEVTNLCFQELFYPSEVVCVLSQEGIGMDKWINMIRKFV